MGIAPLAFSGVTSYSQDFQTILTRAVNIASLPLTQLQNEDSDTLTRKSLLGTMQTTVGNLTDAISNLSTVASSNSLGATSSDPSKVTIALSGTATAGSYAISNITSLATAASEMSQSGYADPAATSVSANGSMRLAVGGKNYDFTLSNNSLSGLRDEINSLNAGVSANIIATDTGSFLTVTSNSTGSTTLSLIDDPGDNTHANTQWLTNQNQGSNASFLLNGKQVTRTTNVIADAIPGATMTLLGTTPDTETINLNIRTDPSQLSSALQAFVTKYNAAVDELDKHCGPNADLLLADSSVLGVQSLMRQISGYRTTEGGAVSSLADLGISVDNNGKMTLDSKRHLGNAGFVNNQALSYIAGLGTMSPQLGSYSDPVTGVIHSEQDALTASDQRLQGQISDTQDRINVMQTSLQARLQAVDALLAQLASQQQMLTASIQSLNLATFGNQNTSGSQNA
jgi:flagellar hook-associated protein 2